MRAHSTTTAAALDLAADSPLSYAELAELNRTRLLAPRLAAMTPAERIGAAAVMAEATGRDISRILDLFARLVEEAEAAAARAAEAEPAGFASIARADIFDAVLAAVDYARGVAPTGPWYNAVYTAYGWLLEQDAYHFDAEAHALRVESASEPGRFYVANGSCQCRAAELGRPCWHRAAARLVARALDLRQRAAEIMAEPGLSPAQALRAASAEAGYPLAAL